MAEIDPAVQQTAADVEDVRSGRAADLAAGAATMARGLAREETERAVKVAEQRARQEQRVESRLDQHDSQFKNINGSLSRAAVGLEALANSFLDFVKKQEKRDTEADTREAQHWKQEGQAFSKKQLYLGFGALLAMVAAPFVAKLVELAS
jgi:hypothetical protein